MEKEQWLLCPICQNKTRIKLREDTELKNFPLFCPKCRQETLINVRQLNTTVIKEPDAQPITRKMKCGYRLCYFWRYCYVRHLLPFLS